MSPLTPEERRWVGRLRRVLRAMPRRLLLVESADRLFVVDRDLAADARLEDGRAHSAGIVLADLPEGFRKVTGVSG